MGPPVGVAQLGRVDSGDSTNTPADCPWQGARPGRGVCGFGVVANLNYLLLHYMPDQRWDPLLRRWDMALYSLWAGPLSNLNGFFPLIPNGFLLHLFDSAYLMLIPQVIFVAYLMSQEPDPHAFPNFLRRLFGYYLTAIAIYAMFPVNGPHLFFPEQQDLAQIPASSRGLLEGMAHDYRVARTHGVLSGFGYFIGLPSLHALGAMFLQYKMRRWPVLFRAFLPINLLLATATIVLGYHYLADIAASVVIFSVSMVWNAWAAGRVSRQPAAVSMAPEEPIIET
jgi:hypothetical protein